MNQRLPRGFGESSGRALGLPRTVRLGIGLLSLGALVAGQGFVVRSAIAFWLHVSEGLLVSAYIADRILTMG
jgi:hypothetical protein